MFSSGSFNLCCSSYVSYELNQAAPEEQQRGGAGGPAQEEGGRNGFGRRPHREGEPRDRLVGGPPADTLWLVKDFG